jgi:hypothetical protein
LWHLHGTIAGIMSDNQATNLENSTGQPYNRSAMVGKKKPEALRKSMLIRVRLSPEQHNLLSRAAERNALTVSSWLRTVGMAEARRILGDDA